MSFSAVSTGLSTFIVAGDGWWPDMPVADFQQTYRLPQEYPLAVARIGDRRLNQTPASIAHAQTAFMAPLRAMSRSRTILGIVFPGEIEPPKDGDITLTWVSKYSVEINIAARPYNCPKKITCIRRSWRHGQRNESQNIFPRAILRRKHGIRKTRGGSIGR